MQALCCWCGAPLEIRRVNLADVWVCSGSADCRNRQGRHALALKVKGSYTKLLYMPLPKQTVAHEAVESGQYRRILYGGAAGGSKSHFLRWLAYGKCMTHEGFRALLLRRTFPELEKTHIRASLVDAKKFGATALESKRMVEFPNESLLEFGHCQDSKDVTNYLSAEYDLILFDELVTFEANQYLLISSRARTTRTDWKPLVVAGTNPGGPHSHWVVERFIEKTCEEPHYKADEYAYIPATLDDNPYIDASYEQLLNDLPGELREAYRHGRWDIFPGQYFREFRKEKHVVSMDIPSELPRICGMDWGYLRPGCVLWAVVLPDGHLHIEREWVFKETLAVEAAKQIKERSEGAGFTVHADPAMWIRSGDTGESIAETLMREGVPLYKAKNERVNGWQRVRHWLRDSPSGRPWLTISPNCPYLIRTLPSLVQDETKLEDIDTTGDDHGADALRYLTMSRPAPLVGSKPELPRDAVGHLLREAMRDAKEVVTLGSHNVRF